MIPVAGHVYQCVWYGDFTTPIYNCIVEVKGQNVYGHYIPHTSGSYGFWDLSTWKKPEHTFTDMGTLAEFQHNYPELFI